MNYRFHVDKRNNSIYLTIRHNYEVIKLNSGQKVRHNQFDQTKQVVIRTGSNRHEEAFEINSFLGCFLADIQNKVRHFIQDNKTLNFSELKLALIPPKQVDLFFVYDAYIDSIKSSHAPATIITITKHKNNLEKFVETYNLKPTFDNVNMLFFDSYKNYLIGQEKVNHTILRYVGALKTFMSWALDRNYHKNTEFLKFSYNAEANEVIALSENELALIEKKEFETDRLIRAKDLFVFQCYTGLRVSDLMKLNSTDFHGDHFKFRTKKTRALLNVPLCPASIEIADKYDYELPRISSQKYNDAIKDVCKSAGIDATVTKIRYSGPNKDTEIGPKYNFITSHTARRTFITLSLEKGISPKFLCEITGQTLKTMMKYIGKDPDKVKQEFQRIYGSPLKLVKLQNTNKQ
ncbi:MAG: phage integrase SAM-like domain-containing protein [Bacteroidetes bacterium]|nr:phage integrase SAM-like domain-containing protein [Bacteroidota bacterium]